MAENGRCEAIAGIARSVGRSGIAVVTLERLADCEQPNIDYRSQQEAQQRAPLFNYT